MNFDRRGSVLNWMANIIAERFGHGFTLRENTNGTVALRLNENSQCITLAADNVSFTRMDSDLDYTEWDAVAEGWRYVLGSPLPAPGVKSLPSPLITTTAQGMHIAYDILGLMYWMLCRLEEVGRTDLAEHGWFSAKSSHAFKHGYLERPVVDEWLHILGQVIQCVWPSIELKQHQFSMKVSHDVDSPSLYAFKSWGSVVRMMVGHLLKRHDIRLFLQAPYTKLASCSRIHPTDPFNTFDWIMDQSERHGTISAFYFICGHSDPLDADYELEDTRIRHLLRHIHARGHEIGLHPSYGAYQKPDVIRQEADRLRFVCAEEGIQQNQWGGRMHYLRWEQPTTLQALSDAGLNYDSTLGYADRPGFRCGTCFEYPAFNPVSQQILPLRVRPLVMMESSVIDDAFLGLGTGAMAFDKALALKNSCKSVNGCFTLLWHNSDLRSKQRKDMYVNLLG